MSGDDWRAVALFLIWGLFSAGLFTAWLFWTARMLGISRVSPDSSKLGGGESGRMDTPDR